MAKITGIHIHDCTSITASFESSNGTSWLTIKYGDVLQNINIFMDPARAEMIANAINRAEDDYEKIAAERADDGTKPDKDQNKEHRLGMHELLGRAW
jgi:hypothetical protein